MTDSFHAALDMNHSNGTRLPLMSVNMSTWSQAHGPPVANDNTSSITEQMKVRHWPLTAGPSGSAGMAALTMLP